MNDESALFGNYLSGELGEEETRQFSARLAREPRLRDAFAAYLLDEALLVERFDAQQSLRETTQDLSESQRRRILPSQRLLTPLKRSRRGTARMGRPRRSGLFAAAAAAMLLAAGAWIWWRSGERTPAWSAEVVQLQGTVQLRRGRVDLPAGRGTRLLPGDALHTDRDARLEFRCGAGTRVELDGNSALLLENRNTIAFGLPRGAIFVQAAEPLAINPDRFDQVAVLGTAFEVSKADGPTVLRVLEGVVRFGAPEQAVPLTALQASQVLPGGSPSPPQQIAQGEVAAWRTGAAKPTGAGATAQAAGTTVYRHEFAVFGPFENSPNRLLQLQEAGAEVTAIVSLPHPNGSPTWNPDVYIELGRLPAPSGRTDPFFAIPQEMEIRIRIRAEKPGRWNLGLEPSNRRGEEHFDSREQEVGPEWREVRLRSADIIPYRRPERVTRDLVPGVGITGFAFYGWGTGKLFVDRMEVVSLVEMGNPK